MKTINQIRSVCVLAFLLTWFCAFGALRVWDGGGADDNFSTPENWAGDVAPSSGDCLVFMGRTRTSPYNDLDPASYSFTGIVFSNTTATCNAPFTLKGNRIRITGSNAGVVPGVTTYAFGIWPIASSATITDVLELDVDLPNNSKLGCYNGSNHNLTFKGTVTGGNGSLTSLDQYAGILTFEGPVKNFTNVLRPNGMARSSCFLPRTSSRVRRRIPFARERCAWTALPHLAGPHGAFRLDRAAGIRHPRSP